MDHASIAREIMRGNGLEFIQVFYSGGNHDDSHFDALCIGQRWGNSKAVVTDASGKWLKARGFPWRQNQSEAARNWPAWQLVSAVYPNNEW